MYLVVGSFLTVKALSLFGSGYLHLGESSSIYNSVCPVEMALFLNPKTSCSVCPSPPCHSRCTPLVLFGTWPHHTVTMLCWPYVLSICQVSLLFCPHWHSPGSCSLRIRLPTTSLSTAPTLPSLHQKKLLQEGIWLYPSLSRTMWWLPATFVIKVKYHSLTSKWFLEFTPDCISASSSPTHIPFPGRPVLAILSYFFKPTKLSQASVPFSLLSA